MLRSTPGAECRALQRKQRHLLDHVNRSMASMETSSEVKHEKKN